MRAVVVLLTLWLITFGPTDSALVRPEQIPRDPREGLTSGVAGDPRASSIALGQLGVDLIITKTVAAIQAAVNAKR